MGALNARRGRAYNKAMAMVLRLGRRNGNSFCLAYLVTLKLVVFSMKKKPRFRRENSSSYPVHSFDNFYPVHTFNNSVGPY